MQPFRQAIHATAVLLARVGLIDESRGKHIAELAWPRIVTGLARTSQRTADFVMVGVAVGPAGIAGMGFAFAYWSIANAVGFSLANGAMTFLSQRFGAEDVRGFDLAFKQTLWIELTFAGVFMAIFVAGAELLIGILGAAPASLSHGTIYLQVIALGLGFEVTSQLASRAFVSANDAWTPMVIRGGGALMNIVLNAVFIFGLGLGVFGAALGTVLSAAAICVVTVIGLVWGRLPYLGSIPARIYLRRPLFDGHLMKQIIEVSMPLVGRRILSRGSQFLMLAIVAQFGTIIVAAYVASREVREIMNAPGWGFGTAARSVVGQELGTGAEQSAKAYGRDLVIFALVVYLLTALIMFLFAPQLATLFTNDPGAVAATVPFLRVMALSLLGLGLDEAAAGVIAAAGDTQWPMFGRIIGLYVFMVPIAYLGVITPIGVVAVYVAITAETSVPAAISYFRYRTGKWISISRQYREVPVG